MKKAYLTLIIFTGLTVLLQGCSGGGGGAVCGLGTGSNVVISGQVTYDRVHHNADGGLDYTNITREPVRGALVEAVCNDVVSTATTDAAGRYTVTLPGNTTNASIRVKAQMLKTGTPAWDYTVVDNSQGQALYSMSGDYFDTGTTDATRNLHAVSGWTGAGYTETRVAAPFAILDSVYDAHQTILNEEPNAVFPPLKINWHSENTDGTYYDGNQIFVLGKANNDTDEYDYHVIIHEWGHYFQDSFSRDDSIGGNHSGSDVLDIRVAFSEGFGNAFSAIASGNANYADSLGLAQNRGSFTIDMENNNCTTKGWYSECSVQSIIYDLHDGVNDINDTVNLGFAPLYRVLKTDMPNYYAFTSIFSFISPLRSNNLKDALAIDSLLTGQNIDQISDEFGDSIVSNDPGVVPKLPVYENGLATLKTLCSTGEHQGYNGLGVYRYIRVTGSGTVTFNATRNNSPFTDADIIQSDPDFELFLRGQRIATAWSATADSETLTATLQANQTYILQVNEDTYFNPDYSGSGATCFNVSMQ